MEALMAQREQIIIFHNKTSQKLKRDESWLDHGEWWSDDPPPSMKTATWFNAPPSVIEAGQTVAWGSQSAGIIAPIGGGTGTEGGVDYNIPLGGEKLHIYWDVPYVGQSRALSFAYLPPLVHFDVFTSGNIGTVFSENFFSKHSNQGTMNDSPFFNFGSSNPNPWDEFTLVAVGSAGGALSVSDTKRVYDAVWRPGKTGEMQFYGMGFKTYLAKHDELWKKNWRLHLLNTYVENGKRLYDAVWRPGKTGEMHFYGMDLKAYLAKHDELWKKNWRLHLLNTYVENGKRLYDAVWRPGETGEMHFYGMDFKTYQAKYDELWKKNWRLHLLNTYVENGKRLYDAVWRPGKTGEMQFYNLSYNGLQAQYKDLWKKNWRVELLNTYEVPV
jgi:hypothetical protein